MKAHNRRDGRVPACPTLNQLDRKSMAPPPREAVSNDQLDYYATADRWQELGRKVQDMAKRARALGVPVESLPGAPGLLATFRALRKRLDRHAR